jgi:23S rRNA pseudouridine955/2504/2580 synthase
MAVNPKPKVSYITVDDEFSGQRLDNFLLRELKGVPRSLIYRIVRRGEVRVNEGRSKASTRLNGGDRVRVPPIRVSRRTEPIAEPHRFDIPILYEDDHLVVVDKPAGLAVHAGSGIRAGLIEIMRQQRSEDRFLDLVHRLDRETSGCLVLARRRSTLRRLHEDLRLNPGGNSQFKKKYLALVNADWEVRHCAIEIPLRKNAERGGERVVIPDADGLYARSVFSSRERYGRCTLMEVSLMTGRTHQIRVHAAASGHPVLGDEKYGDKEVNAWIRSLGLKRLFLHASSLGFLHPMTQERVEVRSALPPELEQVLDKLAGSRDRVDNPR